MNLLKIISIMYILKLSIYVIHKIKIICIQILQSNFCISKITLNLVFAMNLL